MSKKPRITMAKPRIATADYRIARPPAPRSSTDDVRTRGQASMDRSARLRRRHPLCCICAAEGRVTAATVIDHRHALVDGGSDHESNCWPLCKTCHDRKTNDENRRRAAGEHCSAPLAWLPPRPKELDL
jgi:5-methylcytosine-specific restriction protein A